MDNKLLSWFYVTVMLAVMLLGSGSAVATETVTYFHNDIAGTPMLETDANGNVVWKESYYPYGDRLKREAASSDNALWFTGKPSDDDTGLSYMGARYYDPVIGRFMGVDPKEVDPGDIYSFNRYAYANDNPYAYVDPNGEGPIPAPFFGLGGPNVQLPTDAREARNWGHYDNDETSGFGWYLKGPLLIGGVALGLDDMLAVGEGAETLAGDAAPTVQKGTTELSKSAQKGIRTLERRIAEHEKKLADFKANPTVRPGMEGQPEAVIKAAQESRIRHLEREIQTFRDNIAKLMGRQ